jgi:K+-transporting ATPase ATPase B chain
MIEMDANADTPSKSSSDLVSHEVPHRATYGSRLIGQALIYYLRMLDPRQQVRNPVMFVVWLGMLVTATLTVEPTLFGSSSVTSTYNGVVTVILFLTVWFANLAESLAEGRGKAQAAFLRQTRTELKAKRLQMEGRIEEVLATALRKGDLVRVEQNDVIPSDAEVIEGMAYVDESAVTGEAAPVLKEAGTDMFSFVTAGTTVVSEWLVVRVESEPGKSFLDRMIHLVEGAKRQKTPNEIASR